MQKVFKNFESAKAVLISELPDNKSIGVSIEESNNIKQKQSLTVEGIEEAEDGN